VKRRMITMAGLFVGLASPLLAQAIQDSPSTGQQATEAKRRDQEALLVLSGTIEAAGGTERLRAIHDFTETGTITYSWAKGVTGNVTVKSQGHDRLKIDADLPLGKQTTVISNNGGTIIPPTGSRISIDRQSVTDLGNLTLPALSLLEAVRDSSISVVYGGLVNHNGAQVYDVRLLLSYPKAQDLKGTRSTDEARDFYIDPKTLFVSAIADTFRLGGSTDASVGHEVAYSNYTLESGIMTPLAITESVRGKPAFSMTLTEVTLNPGLVAADFSW
jgi:hypothetical protein